MNPTTRGSEAAGGQAVARDDPRTIFGWCMYDWANSAYATTVVAALLPRYFADVVAGPEGLRIAGHTFGAETLWAFIVGASSLVVFLTAPVLGAVADFTSARKRFLLAFAYGGCLFTLLLYFCRSGDIVKTLLLFLAAQIGFVGGNVFYDSFLPHIASPGTMDRVSGRGYAYGYVGGGLQFALALLLVAGHGRLGLSQAEGARLGIAMAGLWWAGFTLFTARDLREVGPAAVLPERYRAWPRGLALAAVGFARTLGTTRRVRRFRHLLLFLLAFMLYDDAIQTVINMATIYGTVELKLPATDLMLTLLLVQAIAIVGALVFGRLGESIGTRRAVMLTLVLWSGAVVYACFIRTSAQFFALGAVIGLVLGGSQALSRSFFGSMIPAEASAEFYGFYTVFSKFSAIWGPWVFAVVKHTTGSSRMAILSLVALLVGGLVLLAFVDEEKAREAARAGAF